MNKNELIDALAKKTDLKKTEAGQVVDGFINAVTDALVKKDSVTLVGFGTFKVASRKAREGRNPKTGAKMTIAAKDVPVFKPGKKLKDDVK
jgi:DNA-binding protein HU-beta